MAKLLEKKFLALKTTPFLQASALLIFIILFTSFLIELYLTN
jgi:hypothetical protein